MTLRVPSTNDWARGFTFALRRAEILGTLLPRTMMEWVEASRRPADSWPPPAARSVRQIGEIGVDELFISANALIRPGPHRHEMATKVRDLEFLADDLRDRHPLDLHPAPAPLSDPEIVKTRAFGTEIERLQFPSECTLPAALRARVSWAEDPCNEVARAIVLRHPGPPRSWVVCVHGAGQGRSMDLMAFRARHLHHDLGLNVALPVLPLHGPRMVEGVQLPSFDFSSNVAAVLQGVHDIRRLVSWILAQGAPRIAVYGVSLGGHTASILAGVDPNIDTVIAGIPVTGLAQLLMHQLERFGGRPGQVMSRQFQSEALAIVDRVVSPLALPIHPPHEGRFIFAGLGDVIAPPNQAVELWEHWERPALHWYGGGHVSHFWSGGVRQFVDAALGGLEPVGTPPKQRGEAA